MGRTLNKQKLKKISGVNVLKNGEKNRNAFMPDVDPLKDVLFKF